MKIKATCVLLAAGIVLALSAQARFEIDRSVMSENYWKVWNDDLQKRIDADIEKHRKADAAFEVSAPDGADVKVEQISHAFFFGAHIFNFGQLGTKERNERYRKLYDPVNGLFNSATVAFYWRTLEPQRGNVRFDPAANDSEEFWNGCKEPWNEPHWRRPPCESVVSFLESRGMRIHGHPLVWGNNAWMRPNWIWDEMCPEAEKQALEKASGVKVPRWDSSIAAGRLSRKHEKEWQKAWRLIYGKLGGKKIAKTVPTYLKVHEEVYEERVRQIAERYGKRIHSWDVVNESATDFGRFGRKAVRKSVFDGSRYGPMPADYAYKAFVWAQKYLPETAWLNINDYNVGEVYSEQVKDLAANGAKIDVVGVQMHLFNPKESSAIARGEFLREAHSKTHPDSIKKRFDRLSALGRPIHLSEITITAPDNSARGQMIQAIIARNLYRAWFSVEKMNGITWWNVVDNCGAPTEPSISGIFSRDMQPKAAYFALDDLINREWKTKASVKAKGGKVSFRGFKGRYRLTWKDRDGKLCEKLVDVK